MLSHERSGPPAATPVLLLHAGVADRRMWDPVWPALTAVRDVVRVDLRGFGESDEQPTGAWSARGDVLETLDHLGITAAHVVGCSYGAGIAVEVALERPPLVRSLVLAAPGGALLTEKTDELAASWAAEGAAIDAGDFDEATEVNVRTWVDGPRRGPDAVPADVRDAVRRMQRQAFAIQSAWPDAVWEAQHQLEPEAHERLGEIGVPTLVISGEEDVDAVGIAADHLLAGVRGVRAVVWPGVAHLPSMERPDDFAAEVLDWVARAEA